MRAKLDDGPGKAYYAQRSRTIEPVFGQVKTIQGGWRFMRRGCGLARPSGSCCAAPTTCSSSGARPRHPQADQLRLVSLSAPSTGAASEPPNLKPR
jgi:hypothetical protein